MDPGPSYTVLRIKRKATEPPLSSLVIQGQDPSHQPSRNGFGTPKRRRDVSYRPKPRGIFKLADTVPDSWVGQGAEGEVLQERIRGLIGSEDVVADVKGKGKGREVVQDEEEEAVNDSHPPSPPPRPVTPPVAAKPGMQYRVINQPTAGVSVPRRRADRRLGDGPSVPPVVRSYAEVRAEEQAKSLFRFIDAQAISASSEPGAAEEEGQDPQMAAFQDMLNEYLTLEKKEAARQEAEDEYVYDLYYRDIRDSAVALRAGDGGPVTSIGALIGFNDFSPPSSPSSSEPEDEADEDSNDEDFYRNDYPEDEDADEDMEGFDDAFASGSESDRSEGPKVGGVMGDEAQGGESDEEGFGNDDGGEGGRGGKWGYR